MYKKRLLGLYQKMNNKKNFNIFLKFIKTHWNNF